jgi:hypothetical protein
MESLSNGKRETQEDRFQTKRFAAHCISSATGRLSRYLCLRSLRLGTGGMVDTYKGRTLELLDSITLQGDDKKVDHVALVFVIT